MQNLFCFRLQLLYFDIPEPDIISMVLQADLAFLKLSEVRHIFKLAAGNEFLPVIIP